MKYFLYNYSTRFVFLVTFMMLFWHPINSIAQEAQGIRQVNPSIPYAFSSESSTYVNLRGGNVVSALSNDDEVSGKLPLGFSFRLGCETYTDFYASSNGTLSFNNPFYSLTNATSSLTPADLTLLAPLWDDLHGGGGTFSYVTRGTAPNRVFTAEWKNWKWNYNAATATISFQVKLYEGSNTIEYIYNQEPNSKIGTTSASIGMFNGRNFTTAAKQLWLNSSSANPMASVNFISNINIRPATGQLYRFTRKDNEESCDGIYYGQTLINKTGGTNATDGLRITLSGAANMQIQRENKNQIYDSNDYLLRGTSTPYAVPGSTHGIVLAVGNTYFAGGTLTPESATSLEIVSSTQQSRIESPVGHFVNEIKMIAVKNGLIYDLTIKYTYDFPENYFFMDYTVTIPEGNTEEVKLAHGWDTFLQGDDKGPGFVSGTAPNLVVGVARIPVYEAFEYIGGVPWSGYFSAYYANLKKDLGPTMTFKNTIDSDSTTDNGIGISMNFGSISGSFTSSNKLVFACDAGSAAPALAKNGRICQAQILNLNNLITSPTPLGTVLTWKDVKGAVVTDPTTVTTAGTYTAYYHSVKYNCDSPSGTIVITLDTTCGICYKPSNITGTEAGSLTIISTLDRKNYPAIHSRNGALILESKEKGLVISRIARPETTIVNPVEGMLVFDTISNCLKLYNGIIWNCIEQTCVDNK